MKISLTLLLNLICAIGLSQKNYQIEVNGQIKDISLEKPFHFNLDGQIVKIKVSAKDTLLYEDAMIRFKYPKEFQVQSVTIDQGIEQLMLMTADGSGFIIQKYDTFNPTMLNEMMMNEVTKESVNYGFNLERKDYTRTLKDKSELKVSKAILTYKDETNIYEIASVGKKDQGLMFMAMEMDDIDNSLGKALIKSIWKSLEIVDK